MHSNVTVPVKADHAVTDDEMKNHHVLLIGRPDTNAAVGRLKAEFPVTFGSRSFTVRGETYAHADSAVLAAAENPANPRFSVVLIAGMGPASTLRTAPKLATRDQKPAEVVVYAPGTEPLALVVPAKKLVRDHEKTGGANGAQ